jgi:ammonia channel protein AmtB
MQFRAYVIFSLFITAIVYPVSGFWKWGGGWLDQLGFYDFAGSVVVHAVGGFAALAAAMVLGPRIGRFKTDSEAHHLQGHSLALAASGVLILWVGWFGFNPGSQLAFAGEANIHATMTIAVNTTLAAFAPYHAEHLAEYGAGNEARLTGAHETASFAKFSYGVSDRGASIRIPIYTVEHDWKGYLEDRRPASNADPYRVAARIVKTVREAHKKTVGEGV